MKIVKHTSAIGLFDSGMGGISVLRDAVKFMPNEKYIYYGDSMNAPYGVKSREDIEKLSISACDFLVQKGVKAIIVACNTATSAAIKILRNRYTIPIIGMEPAVKPALKIADEKKTIVLATPITLAEEKFRLLIKKLKAKEKVIKIPAPKLVQLVESGDTDYINAKSVVESYFKHIAMDDIGAIVLGCTHFIFLKDCIKQVIKKDIPIIDGNKGTVMHLNNVLKLSDMLNKEQEGNVKIYNSSEDKSMIELSKRLFSI
ncbi:glutamate racemase [Clostridiaceae bacterium M8S5]|nr:glutamate racemase [Clostridiaceae bacterium M8S5]